MKREQYGETFQCVDCLGTYDIFYEYKDDHTHETICENCFNTRFEVATRAKDKEWFINNFNNPAKEFPKLTFLTKGD